MLKNYFFIYVVLSFLLGCTDRQTTKDSDESPSSKSISSSSDSSATNTTLNRATDTLVSHTTQPTENSVRNILIGIWDFDNNYSESANDVQTSAIMNGSTTYNPDGGYNQTAKFIISVINQSGGAALALSYDYEETGKWELYNGETLLQTVLDTRLTPSNDVTREYENDNPNTGFHQHLPLRGEQTTFRIKSISSNLMDLVEKGSSNQETTYRKKL